MTEFASGLVHAGRLRRHAHLVGAPRLRDRREPARHRRRQGGRRLRPLPSRGDVALRVARRLPRQASVTVSADYDYYVPTFDADSIWNFFAGEPMNDLGLRANVDVTDRALGRRRRATLRIYDVQTAPSRSGRRERPVPCPTPNYALGQNVYPSNGHPFDEGGNLSARYRTGDTTRRPARRAATAATRATAWAPTSRRSASSRRGTSRALRTGVWQWNDKLRPDRDATSFNYVLGPRLPVSRRARRRSIEWEHDMNRLVGQRFRLMLLAHRGGGEMKTLLLRPARAPARSSLVVVVVPAGARRGPRRPLHGLAPLADDQQVPRKLLPPGVVDPDDGPSDVIFPPQHLTLRFNHASTSTKDIGATCKTCHAGRLQEQDASQDSLVPHGPGLRRLPLDRPRRSLEGRSAGDDAMGKCAFCHLGYKAGDGNVVAQLSDAARQPALRPQGARRPQHRLRPVPRRGRAARARHARPAPAHARLLQLPPDGRLGVARRRQERVRHVPRPRRRSGDAHQDDVRDAARCRPPRWLHNAEHTPGLHRAAQARRGRRLAVLRQLPQGGLLHRLPRRARAAAHASTRTTT